MKIPFGEFKQWEIEEVSTWDLEELLKKKLPYKLRNAIESELDLRYLHGDPQEENYGWWNSDKEENDELEDCGDIEDTIWDYSSHDW